VSLAPTATRRRPAAAGVVLLAGLALTWGAAWPTSKIVLDEMPVLAFRTTCVIVGGAGALLMARLAGERIRLPRGEIGPLILVSLLNVTGWQLAMAYGLHLMTAGHASIIAYIMPACATLFGWLVLKERLGAARLWGLGLSMAGLAVLVAPDLDRVLAAPAGVLLMVLAAASWAAGTVGMKYFRWSLTAMQTTGWQFVIGGIPIVLAAAATGTEPSLATLSPRAAASLAYVLIFPVVFAQWAWFRAVELLPGSVSAMGTLAIPVVGTLSSALLLGEPLQLSELVALTLVVAGLALVALRPVAEAS
jgi:drug/metabolite transporter (DMT)-like permease